MLYSEELSNICKEIIRTTTEWKAVRDKNVLDLKDRIYSETKNIPKGTCFYARIKLIANQEKFQSRWSKVDQKTKREMNIVKTLKNGEIKYKDKVEGYDYLVCEICHAKVGSLSGHVKLHNFTSEEYKEIYNLKTLKAQIHCDRVKGSKNPAYQHGGKYSPFSKNFIKGYDEEWNKQFAINTSIRNNENPEQTKFRLEYWLKETNGDEEKAKELYIKFQTRNLDWFIEKYGSTEGLIRYNNKTEKWQNTLNSKSEEELMDINKRKLTRIGSISKAEHKIFEELKKIFPEIKDQFSLPRNLDDKQKFYVYDMQYKNKIIEYNGDFWHSNPEIYSEDFINPYSKLDQKSIHEKDADKLKVAQDNNYEVLVIWESDYNKDKKKVIDKCIEFLKD